MDEIYALSIIDTSNSNDPQNPHIHLLGGEDKDYNQLNTHRILSLKEIIGPKVYKEEWLRF